MNKTIIPQPKYSVGQLVLVNTKIGIEQHKIESIHIHVYAESNQVRYGFQFTHDSYAENQIMLTKKEAKTKMEESINQIPLMLE